jgi:hypothetical protein
MQGKINLSALSHNSCIERSLSFWIRLCLAKSTVQQRTQYEAKEVELAQM